MAFWTFLIILICEIFCLLWGNFVACLFFFFPSFLPHSLFHPSFFLLKEINCFLIVVRYVCAVYYTISSMRWHPFMRNSLKTNTQHLKNIFLNTTVELDCMKYNLKTGNRNKFQSMFLNTRVLGSMTGSCGHWGDENPVWKISTLFLPFTEVLC